MPGSSVARITARIAPVAGAVTGNAVQHRASRNGNDAGADNGCGRQAGSFGAGDGGSGDFRGGFRCRSLLSEHRGGQTSRASAAIIFFIYGVSYP